MSIYKAWLIRKVVLPTWKHCDKMKLLLCVLLCAVTSTWAKPAQSMRQMNPMFNPGMYQGDMKRGPDRNAIPRDSQRWPGGVIPYQFQPGLNPKLEPLVLEAMAHISSKTCIKFVERTTEKYFLDIFQGEGCWAYWGHFYGENKLCLQDICLQHGIVVHELTHTIGFEHEHNRADRDKYLNIHWENIDEVNYDAFTKIAPQDQRLLTSFDFDSIMLYGSKNGAKTYDLDAMTAKDGRTLVSPEDKKYLSQEDIKRIKMLYKC